MYNLQFLYPLHAPFFPLSEAFFLLYNPGRVEKSRYLCNQSARLLSLGAESFSRFELIAGWNVIKVRVEMAPHEDAATSRKRKFLPLVLIRASLPPFSTSFHVSFKDRPSKRSVFSIFKKVFSPPPPPFFLRRENYYRCCYHCYRRYVCWKRRQSNNSEQSSRSLLHTLV